MSNSDYKIKKCDVLVIGSGSGALAALEACERKELRVILVNKGPVGQTGLTPTANGGTHAPTVVDKAFTNMIIAGNYLNDQNVSWKLLDDMKDCLERMASLEIKCLRLGPDFACVPCADTLRRCRDIALSRSNLELLEDTLVTRLLTYEGRVCGATVLDIETGEFSVIQTKAAIIATGGFTGELFPNTSNNPFGISSDATGTGHIMAYHAGAELVDMEMIQFVPLPANPRSLNLRYFPEFWKGPYFNRHGEVVIEDSGVYLGNNYSYLFTQKLFHEIEKGNGPIYIDRRNVEAPPVIGRRHATVPNWEARRKLIKSLGIDPGENKIEITIGSHFGMGGIRVNEKTETAVSGLFAAGEVMGCIHGAMRLPGYSLSQLITFGFESGRQAASYARVHPEPALIPFEQVNQEKERILGFLKPKKGPVNLSELKKRLKDIMRKHVYIFRDGGGLEKARQEIQCLKKEAEFIDVPGFKRFNSTWQKAIEFSSLLEVAEIVVESARFREESRGAHFRRDFPQRNNEKWLKHTCTRFEDEQLKISTASVNLERMKPEGWA